MFGDPVQNDCNFPRLPWGEVLTIRNGKNQSAVEQADGPYPICGSGGEIGRATSYITSGDSVIIGRKGNINNPILMREPFWNVDTAFGLEPDERHLTVEYLYEYCQFFDFRKLNKAVTIPSLTKADLLKIKMPLPPMDVQRSFSGFEEQIDKLRFDSLAAHMIMGQICAAANDATFACAPGSCCMCTKMRFHSAKPHFGAHRSCARCTDNAGRWGTD